MKRYCPPTRYDEAPYGTICTVVSEDGEHLYIQIGTDTPHWNRIGEFLEKVFHNEIKDPQFIKNCLEKLTTPL